MIFNADHNRLPIELDASRGDEGGDPLLLPLFEESLGEFRAGGLHPCDPSDLSTQDRGACHLVTHRLDHPFAQGGDITDVSVHKIVHHDCGVEIEARDETRAATPRGDSGRDSTTTGRATGPNDADTRGR